MSAGALLDSSNHCDGTCNAEFPVCVYATQLFNFSVPEIYSMRFTFEKMMEGALMRTVTVEQIFNYLVRCRGSSTYSCY